MSVPFSTQMQSTMTDLGTALQSLLGNQVTFNYGRITVKPPNGESGDWVHFEHNVSDSGPFATHTFRTRRQGDSPATSSTSEKSINNSADPAELDNFRHDAVIAAAAALGIDPNRILDEMEKITLSRSRFSATFSDNAAGRQADPTSDRATAPATGRQTVERLPDSYFDLFEPEELTR